MTNSGAALLGLAGMALTFVCLLVRAKTRSYIRQLMWRRKQADVSVRYRVEVNGVEVGHIRDDTLAEIWLALINDRKTWLIQLANLGLAGLRFIFWTCFIAMMFGFAQIALMTKSDPSAVSDALAAALFDTPAFEAFVHSSAFYLQIASVVVLLRAAWEPERTLGFVNVFQQHTVAAIRRHVQTPATGRVDLYGVVDGKYFCHDEWRQLLRA